MKRTPKWKIVQRWKTSGQALILIIITFFGLLFFLGLMIDLGQIFLAKGYLRRAADAASLAAAGQFRQDRTITDMTNAADEVARMNGVAPTSITVQTCDSMGGTGVLCPAPGDMPKKLVRVTIVMDYPLTFLTLLNLYSVQLTETSVSEAASMDVVLVLDTSESMTFDAPYTGGPIGADPRDASYCNLHYADADACEPFKQVKTNALSFANKILDKDPAKEEDRLAIVTFANGWQPPPQGTQVVPMTASGWTNDYSVAANAINDPITGLKVYDPGFPCPYGLYGTAVVDHTNILSPCRYYGDDGTYYNLSCLFCTDLDAANMDNGVPHTKDPAGISAFTTTDIGGALRLAGSQFAKDKRPDALWVVVLLTDGQANATFATYEDTGDAGNTNIYPSWVDSSLYPQLMANLPLGFCPDMDWVGPSDNPNRRYCQDGNVTTRHVVGSARYDADDFARDQGDFVSCPASGTMPACNGTKGQGAIIFTIGLGNEILALDDEAAGHQKPYGGALLRYLAAVGDDGNSATDPCSTEPDYTKNCGNYFFAQHGTDLDKVFEAIYSRIFTRLTQ
ncbi:MAG: pilus assembly protein TadG-related protein [Anaerolineales bacterium]